MRKHILFLTLTAMVIAAPLGAEIFTVELSSGSTFVTRYQPQEASWDPNMVLVLTEFGNWIALPRQDISRVTSATELKGFGRLINATTIDLGLAPNDAPLPEEEEAQSPLDLLQSLLEQGRPNYDQDQFVRPREAGGGLPVGTAMGLGGGGVVPVPFGVGGGGAATTPPASGGGEGGGGNP